MYETSKETTNEKFNKGYFLQKEVNSTNNPLKIGIQLKDFG